ncbi:glycogen debranching protein GlgX [Rhizobium sp. TRM95796]|uniref:glycogen debranching protein GlgX n=1 Tax=Rhizobium sp. TRM95796 TaxID=2979862 RepID=UPI0021E86A9D|nr:glycogen debranching protein GlgX [Rhizobium sp. TRM95796]MCV3765034.1 glycogen debranching protein GlgX [Rhizobium sp. TRM95796]
MTHHPLGATLTAAGAHFGVFSRHAGKVELCLFDAEGRESLTEMTCGHDHVWRADVEGVRAGQRYGFRAHGDYAPSHGLWYDPSKLLVDPYALELDRPFVQDHRLAAYGVDTADIAPRAILQHLSPIHAQPPHWKPGGLVYEINVRAFTMLHPDIPEDERGTIKALTHPAILAHFETLGVSALELMPITAWLDERHLPPLGLRNSWGYNPIALMALDPRLCPGGLRELAETVATLHSHGLGVILDLVFNHTGESDTEGGTLSMRGLDSLTYYSHPPGKPGELINDTGCGNTLACHHAPVRNLVLDSLRHFVRHAGIDGFRFDLAPILGRGPQGFTSDALLLSDMRADPILKDRILIAEPWDVGPGGYQLGNFPPSFLEWNDRARDDIRLFWRGDNHRIGPLATALSGSSNIFSRHEGRRTRTVNFVAAHDGFTLWDLVSHDHKHNEANGEDNRDGHNENYSWNNGVEGATNDATVNASRRTDVMALLSTLFLSRGAIMLTAGDEFGRSQQGNNNAYAQDNALSWIDWSMIDREILEHASMLSALRRRFTIFEGLEFLTDLDVAWLTVKGEPMQVADWESHHADQLIMTLQTNDRVTGRQATLAVAFNRANEAKPIRLPGGARLWKCLVGDGMTVSPRSVSLYLGPPA